MAFLSRSSWWLPFLVLLLSAVVVNYVVFGWLKLPADVGALVLTTVLSFPVGFVLAWLLRLVNNDAFLGRSPVTDMFFALLVAVVGYLVLNNVLTGVVANVGPFLPSLVVWAVLGWLGALLLEELKPASATASSHA